MTTTFRSLLAATALAGAFIAAPAFADEAPASDLTISGNVALVTDYRFRGLSLSGGDPAVQGGITLTHSSGLYAGTWASSIIDTVGYAGNTGTMELDLFAGYSREVVPGLTADVGLLYYAYPGGKVGKAEFFEPYASLSTTYGPAKFKLGVNYAWSQDAINNDDNLYVYTNVDIAVPSTPLTVSGHVGYTDGPLALPYFTTTTKEHGFDYSVGVSATVLGKLTLGVSYVGVEGPVINGYSDDQIVGTLSVAF
jgi:uncharacterized protein (TIGR02001 family)